MLKLVGPKTVVCRASGLFFEYVEYSRSKAYKHLLNHMTTGHSGMYCYYTS